MNRYGFVLFVGLFGWYKSVTADFLRFAREELSHPKQVGAIFECSRYVANELMRFLKAHKGTMRVIELGAGMGAITRELVKQVKSAHLDVIEINPQYCVELYKWFPRSQYPNVHIHCADVCEFKVEEPYDFIICTLPFNIFDLGLIARMQQAIKAMSKSGTYYSYVEYMGFGGLKRALSSGDRKREFQARYQLIEQFRKNNLVVTKSVWFNLFPLNVHHLKF